jgi:hypothetical protein
MNGKMLERPGAIGNVANLTLEAEKINLSRLAGGHSSARLEPQIVDLAVAGSNPVDHPTSIFDL